MDALAFGLTFGLPAVAGAIAVGLIGKAALKAFVRKPE